MIKPAECLFSSFYSPPPPPGPPCTRTSATERARPGCPLMPYFGSIFCSQDAISSSLPHPSSLLYYLVSGSKSRYCIVSVFGKVLHRNKIKGLIDRKCTVKTGLCCRGGWEAHIQPSLSWRARKFGGWYDSVQGWRPEGQVLWGLGGEHTSQIKMGKCTLPSPFLLHLDPSVLCDAHPHWWGWISFPVYPGKRSSLPETPSRTRLEIMLNQLWGPPLTQSSWHIQLINTGRQ